MPEIPLPIPARALKQETFVHGTDEVLMLVAGKLRRVLATIAMSAMSEAPGHTVLANPETFSGPMVPIPYEDLKVALDIDDIEKLIQEILMNLQMSDLLYATKAEMDANTSEPIGRLATVYADGASNGLYRWNGSAWIKVAEAPFNDIYARLDLLKPLSDKHYYNIVEGNFTLLNKAVLEATVDLDGIVQSCIFTDGTTYQRTLTTESDPDASPFDANILVITALGQSNAVGSESGRLSPPSVWGAKQFAIGNSTWIKTVNEQTPELRSVWDFSLVDLVVVTPYGDGLGEGPEMGDTSHLKASLVGFYANTPSNRYPWIFHHYPSVGGSQNDEISWRDLRTHIFTARAATTANITLSGTQTVGGVALVVDNFCLVKNQTNAIQNGRYQVKSGAWVRAPINSDFYEGGLFCKILEGTLANTGWYSNEDWPALGSVPITFTQFVESGAQTLQYVMDNAVAGTGFWKTCMDDLKRLKENADKRLLTVAHIGLSWDGGEAHGRVSATGYLHMNRWAPALDQAAGSQGYATRLKAIRQRFSADAGAILGQTKEIPMFVYETDAAASEGQRLAWEQDRNIYSIGPHNQMPSALQYLRNNPPLFTWGNAIHLLAEAHRWRGEQRAKIRRRVMIEGEDWKPLRILSWRVSADRLSAVVKLQVPRLPLQINTTLVPKMQHLFGAGPNYQFLYGFSVESNGAPQQIANIVLGPGPDELTISFGAAIPAAQTWKINYLTASYVGNMLTSSSVRAGPTTTGILSGLGWPTSVGQPTTEVVCAGFLGPEWQPLYDNGAFYLVDSVNGGQMTVRHIYVEGGNTVFQGENREKVGAAIAAGHMMRAVWQHNGLGNICDSDQERSVYTFGSGPRTGRPYPLMNWLGRREGLVATP